MLAAFDTADGGVNSGVETSARMFATKRVLNRGVACSLWHSRGGKWGVESASMFVPQALLAATQTAGGKGEQSVRCLQRPCAEFEKESSAWLVRHCCVCW
jgi:hypothetical protein